MPKPNDPGQHSDKETARRMEDAIRRTLTSSHKAQKDVAGKRNKSAKRKAKGSC